MKRIFGVCALLAMSIAAPALAQVQTGSILVKAADEQGGMMPGVTITITSPVLVSGSMTAMTTLATPASIRAWRQGGIRPQ